MDAAPFIAFNLTLLAAMAAPGPALLHAMRQTLAGGRRAGLLAGVGLGLVAALWTGAALAGLEALFALAPWAWSALKLGGAAYLIWIAVGLWRDADKPLAAAPAPARRAVLGGAAVNLANPKSVLFAASVLVVLFPPDMSVAQKALIVVNHFAVECAVYAGLAVALSRPAAQAAYIAARRGIDRAAGVVMGALGLRLLLDR